MNPTDELRVAVCKAMWWVPITVTDYGSTETVWYKDNQTCDLPPLTLDLMWQAEEMLTETEWRDYAGILYYADNDPRLKGTNEAMIHATAVQRAHAFLKVKGIQVKMGVDR